MTGHRHPIGPLEAAPKDMRLMRFSHGGRVVFRAGEGTRGQTKKSTA